MSKEEMAEECKRRFLVPIFERDDVEFGEMVESIRKIHLQEGLKNEAEAMERQVIRLVSTTAANVAQMAEYLSEIGMLASGLGIRLPALEEYHV